MKQARKALSGALTSGVKYHIITLWTCTKCNTFLGGGNPWSIENCYQVWQLFSWLHLSFRIRGLLLTAYQTIILCLLRQQGTILYSVNVILMIFRITFSGKPTVRLLLKNSMTLTMTVYGTFLICAWWEKRSFPISRAVHPDCVSMRFALQTKNQ